MNDEFTDLEDELRRLDPRAASPSLEDRLEVLLDQPPEPPHVGSWWQRLGFNRPLAAVGWGLLSPVASAAVAFLIAHLAAVGGTPARAESYSETALHDSSRTPGQIGDSGAKLEAAHTSNVVYKTLDEGVVLDGSQEPVHRLRDLSADLVQWRNPNTGAHWEVAYPREDVRLVPVQAD